MKIDEIIKKSIEIPGISIKRGEFSAELILKERDGKGSVLNISMVRFSLILRAFSHFLLSVVLFLNHRNR